jgi:hypothetical protein
MTTKSHFRGGKIIEAIRTGSAIAAVMIRDIWKLSAFSFQHSAKSLLVTRCVLI